jgi:hypothetical protein
MKARGNAVGLTPDDGESSQAFGARVRKAEAAAAAPKPKGRRRG